MCDFCNCNKKISIEDFRRYCKSYSMDKSQLLEEFVNLKRLLKEYENKQSASINNFKLNENKIVKTQPSKQEMKNRPNIFLNPKKLNTVNNESSLAVSGEASENDTSKLFSKVFINPNFRKPDTLSSYKKKTKLEFNQQTQKKSKQIHKSQTSSSQQSDGAKHQISDLILPKQQISLKDGKVVSVLPVADEKSTPSNSHVIFINPKFNSSPKLNAGFLSSSQIIRRKKITEGRDCSNENLSFETKTNEQLAANMYRKRKIVMKGDKSAETSANDQKRRKVIENIRLVKKIFVNPAFERKHNDSKKCESSSNTENLVTKDTSIIPALLGGKDVPSKFTSVSYPICAIMGPERGKPPAKKTISQRIRTRSTSLVTVSTTKLIRKRKLSQKMVETSGKVLSQPLFVSKTKLVRNASKKIINSALKVKFQHQIPITQAQLSSGEKLNKSRRKDFTDCPFNRMSVVPKPTAVTKIKSKNGKSLKLIRKTINTPLPALAEEVKRQINRKMELRQQANKIAMCLTQSKHKRNQFSKINVPVNVSDSLNCDKNLYKKNNILRKPLTKASLMGKKETNIVAKTHWRDTPSSLAKLIKSKYRWTRKQSLFVISRYKLCKNIVGKITPRDKLLQRKKLKWKHKNQTPKRRLTRKDLSIKKIGGVFYRYSRTTLAKNKPSCKHVSQLQNKAIYRVTSQRRQNRFCLDKSPGRRRSSTRRLPFVRPPSEMSWSRANHCSATSILTQAKQKSIYMLSKKMKKNNEPCLFFHRYGRCSGHERGTCVRLHDKKYIAVCKKFVQGSCTDSQCSLNHTPNCHNMPTCHHFLAGQCGRDNCPYPHIKVSDSAPICLEFLRGFCALGDQCAKRHFEICPSFEKGICARGKYCPYPHPKNKTGEILKGKFKHIKWKSQSSKESESVSTPNLRYFEDVNLQKENQLQLDEENMSEDSDSEEEVEELTCVKKRPQLGELPSFIPLSCSFQEEDT